MYEDHPGARESEMATKAALWTEAAQQRYAELTSLPDENQRTVRMEIGYLQQAKQASEELARKAN
jgi:hypothetical protein